MQRVLSASDPGGLKIYKKMWISPSPTTWKFRLVADGMAGGVLQYAEAGRMRNYW
jgi:hypothetical protein